MALSCMQCLIQVEPLTLCTTYNTRTVMKGGPILPVTFYKTPAGNDPVAEWFRSLHKEDRKQVGLDLLRVQQN